MRIIACIEDTAVIGKILACFEWHEATGASPRDPGAAFFLVVVFGLVVLLACPGVCRPSRVLLVLMASPVAAHIPRTHRPLAAWYREQSTPPALSGGVSFAEIALVRRSL